MCVWGGGGTGVLDRGGEGDGQTVFLRCGKWSGSYRCFEMEGMIHVCMWGEG